MKSDSKTKKNKNDRRRSARYAINLPVRYSLSGGTGWGKILNIGSGGALLTIHETDVARGDLAELFIGWPVLLDDRVHLNLVAKGRVLRADRECVAVKFERCDLRTSNTAFLRQVIPPDQGRGQDLASA